MLYLTDTDVQDMFQKAAVGLKPDGLIFVKENVCKEGFIVDNDDSSLTRSNAYMLELFEKSDMQASKNHCSLTFCVPLKQECMPNYL